MKKMTVEEFGQNIDDLMAGINRDDEPVLVTDGEGRQVVVIPAAWWVPAASGAPPLPADAGPDAWGEES